MHLFTTELHGILLALQHIPIFTLSSNTNEHEKLKILLLLINLLYSQLVERYNISLRYQVMQAFQATLKSIMQQKSLSLYIKYLSRTTNRFHIGVLNSWQRERQRATNNKSFSVQPHLAHQVTQSVWFLLDHLTIRWLYLAHVKPMLASLY